MYSIFVSMLCHIVVPCTYYKLITSTNIFKMMISKQPTVEYSYPGTCT